MADKTFAYLKKRIFDALDEYVGQECENISGGYADVIMEKLPDAVRSSLVRMYESLYIGVKNCTLPIIRPKLIAKCESFCKNIDFVAESEKTGVLAECFEDGRIEIYSEDGRCICDTEISSSGQMTKHRLLIPTAAGEKYSLKASKDVSFYGVCIYDGRNIPTADAVPEYGYDVVCKPSDSGEIETAFCNDTGVDTRTFTYCKDFVFVPSRLVNGCGFLNVTYRKKAPGLSEITDDGYTFDLCDLAFEALVCLAASELCRQEQAGIYTRLLYKYSDYAEALYSGKQGKVRNTFYKRNGRVI